MPVVRSGDLEASRAFYVGFLGFDVGMDEEGFLMLRSSSTPTTQLIVATGDAADQEVLQVDISLEVADVDAVHAEARRLGCRSSTHSPTRHGVFVASSSETPMGWY